MSDFFISENANYILCTSKFYAALQKQSPEKIKIRNNEKYIFEHNRYIKIIITDEATPKIPNTKKVKIDKKNFASDFLKKGKRY